MPIPISRMAWKSSNYLWVYPTSSPSNRQKKMDSTTQSWMKMILALGIERNRYLIFSSSSLIYRLLLIFILLTSISLETISWTLDSICYSSLYRCFINSDMFYLCYVTPFPFSFCDSFFSRMKDFFIIYSKNIESDRQKMVRLNIMVIES